MAGRSTLVGKWHLGALPKFGPLQSGYDRSYGFRSGAVDYYSHINPAGQADLWDDECRSKDDYRRLVRQWLAWNATMLPEVEESFTHSFSGDELADRYGAEEAHQKPDLPTPADTAESPAP